tara:strand:+ start:73 stop:825 length:753 start_codon:yes stop_codon:yes gene_type:complete
MGLTDKQKEDKYIKSYYHCKSFNGEFCKLDWREYPKLFTKLNKATDIPEAYSKLELEPKFFSARCITCGIKAQIFDKKKLKEVKRGKTIEQLESDLIEAEKVKKAYLYDKSDDTKADVALQKKCDKLKIEELEKTIQEMNKDKLDEISEDFQSEILDKQDTIEQLNQKVSDLEDIVKMTYKMLYNSGESKLARKSRNARKSKCINIGDFYLIKREIDELMEEPLSYYKYLDDHIYFTHPEKFVKDDTESH